MDCSCEPMILIAGYYPWLAQPKILEEPDVVVIDESYPWLAQPKVPEEEDLVVIDTWYPWLAEDWLLVEQPLNQSNQPHIRHDEFNEGSHLNGNCEPSDFTSVSKQEEEGLTIEESWEKKEDKKGQRVELQDPLVWREAKNSQFWDGVEIQQEISQQIIFSTHRLRSKEDGSEEVDKYLDSFYALFNTIHLERAWKHTQLYLKFMKFLPNKRKKKDDVFFVSYIPP